MICEITHKCQKLGMSILRYINITKKFPEKSDKLIKSGYNDPVSVHFSSSLYPDTHAYGVGHLLDIFLVLLTNINDLHDIMISCQLQRPNIQLDVGLHEV